MPDELSAKRKFPCPACGAEAEWNPAKQMLACPFCGTQSKAELKSDGTLVEESGLVAALRAIPDDQRGWAAEKKTVRCQSCNAISVFDAARVAQRCDFCGSPALIEITDIKAPIRPSALLPFKVDQGKVRESIRRWYGSHWFAPNNLKGRALTDTLHGLYVPYWTFDAKVSARWTAESGTYYYETRTVYRNGRQETERVQRVRWEPAAGELSTAFDDELVAATLGIHSNLLKAIEPFPTDTLKPYDRGYVAGWVVEQYQIDLVGAAERSRAAMDGKVRALCVQAIPGDTYRNLEVASAYSDQTFKHTLLPVWLLRYDYGRKNYQVVVNGVTGKTAGEQPYSWIKILLAVLAVIAAVLVIAWLQD